MSLDAAARFIALLIENPKLAGELSAATAGKPPEQMAVAMTQTARPLGYDFTPQEAREACDVAYGLLSRPPTVDGELTEQQLEAVTGGVTIGSAGTAPAVGGSVGPLGLATAAVSTVLAPLAGGGSPVGGGASPTPSPLLWELLAAARKEIGNLP